MKPADARAPLLNVPSGKRQPGARAVGGAPKGTSATGVGTVVAGIRHIDQNDTNDAEAIDT